MQNQRSVYGQTLLDIGEKDERIVVLEADLGRSTMSFLFQKSYPERYFEMGIAEQNMVSFAAGLSLTGKIAFVNSFAVFATGRPFDQIRQSVCIGKLNVKIVGSSAGLSDFGDGATHQSIEDVAIMRALPNMTVLVPCDGVETKKMVYAAVSHEGPIYIRICRNDMPVLVSEQAEFVIGSPYVIREGSDVVIFAMGIMVSIALEAAKKLEKQGIFARVVNVSTLKPLADEKIIELANGMKGAVIAEEHSIIGGLTSAVTYALRGKPIPTEAVAILDSFGQSAQDYEEILKHYGLTDDSIVDKAKLVLEKFNKEIL